MITKRVMRMKLHYGIDDLTFLDIEALLPLILPIVIISLILIALALADLYKNRQFRDHKGMWVLIIVFGNTIGPVLYFVFGRKEVKRR